MSSVVRTTRRTSETSSARELFVVISAWASTVALPAITASAAATSAFIVSLSKLTAIHAVLLAKFIAAYTAATAAALALWWSTVAVAAV